MDSSDEYARSKKKRDQEVKNRIKNMSKEAMAAAIARKKECNARAMMIVQHLIEPNVQQIWLLENLKHINQSHFQDIVEERAITKFCGYPLCDKALTNVPKKLYQISTKENKVYDITDRKNYCSNICYKAGTYLKDQLYTSPLWLRDCEIPVEYKILSGSNESHGTGAGAEIDLGNTHPIRLNKQSEKDEVNNRNVHSNSDIKNKSFNLKYKDPAIKVISETNEKIKSDTASLESTITANKEQLTVIKSMPDNSIIQTNAASGSLACEFSVCKESIKILNVISNQNTVSKELSKESQTLISEKTCNTSAIDLCDSDENQKSCISKANRECSMLNSSNRTGAILKQHSLVNVADKHFPQKTEITNITEENLCNESNEVNLQNNFSKKNKYRSQVKKSRQSIAPESPLTSIVSDIEQRIESWFTFESMVYLLGRERVRDLLKISGFKDDFLATSSKKEDYFIYQKCQEIFNKLDILELQDKEKQMPSKPVPSYESLKKEAEGLELKVKSFYRGDSKVTFASTEDVKGRAPSDHDDFDVPALPLIDQYSVLATRRRIFIERLNKVLPDMLSALELSHFCLGGEIQELVSTFSLGPKNICLRPYEWTLIAVMIIKLLTINNDLLNYAYSKEVTQRRLSTYLLAFDLDGGYVDRFTSHLLDIKRITNRLLLQ